MTLWVIVTHLCCRTCKRTDSTKQNYPKMANMATAGLAKHETRTNNQFANQPRWLWTIRDHHWKSHEKAHFLGGVYFYVIFFRDFTLKKGGKRPPKNIPPPNRCISSRDFYWWSQIFLNPSGLLANWFYMYAFTYCTSLYNSQFLQTPTSISAARLS